jgi:transcription elongation GreA/GreB family factor
MQNGIKEKLFEKCSQFVENQIAVASKGIYESQQAANEEGKSSVGDKYETTRAMMQIEVENYTKRLAEGKKLESILKQINFRSEYTLVVAGTLIGSNQGYFFMAIGMGKVRIDNEDYFIISQHSPIGEKFYHKKVGDEFLLNGKKFVITELL